MLSDQKRYLMHVIIRRNLARGLTFSTSMGLAIDEIEGGSYDWRKHFPPTPSDLDILSRDKEGAKP